jgi:hypothetical protein
MPTQATPAAYDHAAWPNVEVEDLWVYDKLILSRYFGHVCGPAGVDLPHPGRYMVKPITNMLGMGRGASIVEFPTVDTDHLQPGTFWMELFTGDHLSIDLRGGRVVCVYKGFSSGPQRFLRWDKLPLPTAGEVPKLFRSLSEKYGAVNYETIGGRVIEVHLRASPDYEKHAATTLIPVWWGQSTAHPNFVSDPDGERLGFLVYR